MKEIRTQDAVGHILCHDITQIIKDQKKGVLFKKGHIVREEDIPALLSVGKEHLFVSFTRFPQESICMEVTSRKARSS